MTTPHSHAAPSSWWTRVADVLHRMLVGRRPARAVGAHVYRARTTGPRMTMAHSVTGRVRAERLERAALAMLRTECERVARLLGGARAGHKAAQHVTMRTALKRDTARTLHRVKAIGRTPARTRFAAAGTVVRTAARETAAVAAHTVRQAGAPAHRHIRGVNDAAHQLAASAVAQLQSYAAAGRAVGENSPFTRPPRGSFA